MRDGKTTQATTLAADAPGREMRHASWVPSWPAPAEGERLISTEQVSLLEGLDRDMHEWERQDGDGCGTQPPKAKGSSARGMCSCGGQHARGKSTALNARERRQSHKATGERLSSSMTAKRRWGEKRVACSTRTRKHAHARFWKACPRQEEDIRMARRPPVAVRGLSARASAEARGRACSVRLPATRLAV